MRKMALYDVEDIIKYLNKIPFRAVALIPAEEEGKMKLLPTSSILIKGQSFNSRRAEIQALAPGADMYYELVDEKKLTPEMRKELKLSKTIIELDDKDIATVIDKRIINLNFDLLSKDELKGLRKLGIRSSKLNFNSIEAIKNSDLSYLLSSDYITASIISNNKQDIVSLDEAMNVDDTIIYNVDNVRVAEYEGPADKILSFYEYDIATENIPPFGGEPFEFEQVAVNTEGEPVWFASPRIIQNKHTEELAGEIADKGNRTLVKIPDGKEGERIRKALELYGEGRIREFKEYNKMGNNYLVEVSLDKKLDNNEVKSL